MDDFTLPLPGLSPVAGRPVKACFDGGSLSSDAGVLVLREVEGRLGVAERLARCLDDPRDPALITHSLADMIRFRMLMIAAWSRPCISVTLLRAAVSCIMATEVRSTSLCATPSGSSMPASNHPSAASATLTTTHSLRRLNSDAELSREAALHRLAAEWFVMGVLIANRSERLQPDRCP